MWIKVYTCGVMADTTQVTGESPITTPGIQNRRTTLCHGINGTGFAMDVMALGLHPSHRCAYRCECGGFLLPERHLLGLGGGGGFAVVFRENVRQNLGWRENHHWTYP